MEVDSPEVLLEESVVEVSADTVDTEEADSAVDLVADTVDMEEVAEVSPTAIHKAVPEVSITEDKIKIN